MYRKLLIGVLVAAIAVTAASVVASICHSRRRSRNNRKIAGTILSALASARSGLDSVFCPAAYRSKKSTTRSSTCVFT